MTDNDHSPATDISPSPDHSSFNHRIILLLRVTHWRAPLFLIALPFVFFWRETLGRRTLGDQDAIFWFLPIYKTVVDQIHSGYLPLWNPNVYSGMPLFAELQAGVLDPLNWIYYFFGVTSRSLTLVQQMAFVAALLGAYGYARSLGWKRRACVITAIVYGFNGFAVARVIYPGLLHIYALSPLIFFFLERIYQSSFSDRKKAWRCVVWGSLIVAWQIFAGHPQPFAYCALVAAAYALFSALLRGGALPKGFSPRLRFLLQCALMYMLGVLITALQLLPAMEFSRESVRSDWSYEAFTAHSLHPASLLVTLFPFFHGGGTGIYHRPFAGNYWHHNEAQIYLGLLVLSLALAGSSEAWRAKFSIGKFWSGVAVTGLLFSMGGYIPMIARMLYRVPLLGSFRSPNRYWMEVALAVSILAGYSVNQLLPEKAESISDIHAENLFLPRSLRQAALLLLTLCVVSGLILLLRHPGAEFLVPILMAAGSSVLVLVSCSRLKNRWSYGLLVAALLADLNLYAAFAPVNSPAKAEESFGPAIPEVISQKNSGPDKWRSHLWLDHLSGEFDLRGFYGHEMVTGYDPLVSAQYKTFSGIDEAGRSYRSSLLEKKNRTLDLLSVRYLLLPKKGTETASSLSGLRENDFEGRWWKISEEQGRDGQVTEIFENRQRLSRAWLVSAAEAAYEGDQLKLITGEKTQADGRAFNPSETALIKPSDVAGIPPELLQKQRKDSSGQGRVLRFEKRGPRIIEVEIESSDAALLVLGEPDYPGWMAEIDGKSADILRVDYFLRGLAVSRGRHVVTLRYLPRSVQVGGVISGVTILLMGLLIFADRRSPQTKKVW